jgi:hypothetical protein
MHWLICINFIHNQCLDFLFFGKSSSLPISDRYIPTAANEIVRARVHQRTVDCNALLRVTAA